MNKLIKDYITSFLDNPNAEIHKVGDGEANWVYRVNDTLFRIPKNDQGKLELKHEVAVSKIALQYMQSVPGIAIPEFEFIHPEGNFAVCKFVPGINYDENEIRAWPADSKRKAAAKLAEIMNALSKIDPAMINASIQKAALDPADFSNDKTIQARYERFKHKASRYYPDIDTRFRQYETDYPNGMIDESVIVVHGDLHDGNILFNTDHEVVGVIDFADMIVANGTYELRNMSGFGMDFVVMVAAKLDHSFGNFDPEKFLNMCILYEMLMTLRYLLKEIPLDKRYREATSYLEHEGIKHLRHPFYVSEVG